MYLFKELMQLVNIILFCIKHGLHLFIIKINLVSRLLFFEESITNQ